MKLKGPSTSWWNPATQGALLAAVAGFIALAWPMDGLINKSYDWAFLFRRDIPVPDAIVIYMDNHSQDLLHQGSWENWGRTIHARLLDLLAQAGAKAVVFDMLFRPASTNALEDAELIRAITNYGKVAVGAMIGPLTHNHKLIQNTVWRPFPALEEVTPWGLAEASDETKFIRQHYRDDQFNVPSLGWRAAEMVGVKPLPDPMAERWINYYGPPGRVLAYVSYADVLFTNLDLTMFAGKLVFVGAHLSIGFSGGTGTDEYRTPYTHSTGRWAPGVEIIATTTLNLIRGDWLRRLPGWMEGLVTLALGGLLGFGLARRRPLAAAGVAVAVVLAVAVVAIILTWQTLTWFPWTIVAFVQVPCALGWTVLTHSHRLWRERNWLRLLLAAREEAASGVTNQTIATAPTAPPRVLEPDGPSNSPQSDAVVTQGRAAHRPAVPDVPNHELLRRIGDGAYGEVWLARDLVGTYLAVKIVYRHTFREDAPFEREFNGLRRFTPISRTHPGLIHILHVGRHAAPECLYYIMEAADDVVAGPQYEAATYVPKTLAQELSQHQRLSLSVCVQLGIDLAGTVAFLHGRQLIHRDIKPSNILFVNGVPKLADIGLVTDLDRRSSDLSYVGTSGYLPPEGPGSRTADVYALGKVLYEAGMGLPRDAFPELPPELFAQPDRAQLVEFNRVILRACAPDPDRRFPSAAELQTALRELQSQLSQP